MVRDTESPFETASRQMNYCLVLETSLAGDSRLLRQVATLISAGFNLTVVEFGKSIGLQPDNFRLVSVENTHPRNFLYRSWQYGLRSTRGDPQLIRKIKETNADVVEAIGPLALYCACQALQGTRTPLVYNALELYQENFILQQESSKIKESLRWVYWKFLLARERDCISRADMVITVSPSIAREMTRRFNIPEPLVVMNCPNASTRPAALRTGPDLLADSLPSPGKCRRLLYSGWLAEGRGIEEMIRALALLKDMDLVVLGREAPGQEHFRRKINSLLDRMGVRERVHFVEMVPAEKVIQYAQWADLGVLPYRKTCLNNWLGIPNKLFEYLMAGLPVAASFQPEYQRILEDNGFGSVFNPDDPADIARKIELLFASREKYDQMRHRVSEKAPAMFSWEEESSKYLHAIDSALHHARAKIA